MGCARWSVDVGNFLPGRREVGHRRRFQRIVGDVEREIARDLIIVRDGILLI
jgi:hypothetical protein